MDVESRHEASHELGIILVNYGEYDSLTRLIAHQQSVLSRDVKVVVVDNTEPDRRDDHYLDRLGEQAGLTVLRPGNTGYLGAAQYARDAVPALRSSRFVAVCNTDILFSFNDAAVALRELREVAEAGSLAPMGLIVPRLVDLQGAPVRQLHYSRPPSPPKYRALSRIYSVYPLAVVHRLASDFKRRLNARGEGSATTTDSAYWAPHGAMMVFSSEYFSATDGFKYPEFLFCEEIYVGLQNQRAGLRVQFCPRLTYSHSNHGSMGAVQSRRVLGYLRDSHRWAATALEDAK